MRFVASTPHCVGATHSTTPDCTYRISWSINPHMVIGGVDPQRAVLQHAGLIRTVRSLGADVETVPFVHGAFDSVFAKDNAIYTVTAAGLTHALFSRPRHPERQVEQPVRAADLLRAGIQVDMRGVDFEGGDVIVVPGRCVILGYGFRSTREAAPEIERYLRLPVLPLELVDPALYHLDTALAVLRDGTVLVCADAFTPASRRALRATGLGDVHRVGRDEALQFALNVVEIGDAVVTGTHSRLVNDILAACGKRVVYTPLDEFHRAGGSAACLLAPVYDDAQTVATAATTAIRSTAA
jgi:N-dimethylarginine dimethylaminohydrolase